MTILSTMPAIPAAEKHAQNQEWIVSAGDNVQTPNKSMAIARKPGRSDKPSRRLALLKRTGLFNDIPPQVRVIRAVTMEDLRDAYQLVHETFLDQGYILPLPGGMRVRPYEAMTTTATFIAKAYGQVSGVQSLIADTGDLGMPSDEAFKDELDVLRKQGRRVCEIGNQAVAVEYRKTAVLTDLMRCCFAHALSTGRTDLIAAVSPGHARFYEFMGFEKLAPVRSFTRKIEDPVLLMRMDLTGLDARFADVDSDNEDDESLLKRLYLDANPYRRRVEAWSIMADRLFANPSALRMLFAELSGLFLRCTQEELSAISNSWGADIFQRVWPIAKNYAAEEASWSAKYSGEPLGASSEAVA